MAIEPVTLSLPGHRTRLNRLNRLSLNGTEFQAPSIRFSP